MLQPDVPRRIPYDRALYVARPDIAHVLAAVRDVRARAVSDALVFRGGRGAGKTWFALDMHCRTLEQMFGDEAQSFYISLEEMNDQRRLYRCNQRVFYLYDETLDRAWPIDRRLQRLLVRIYPHLGVTTASTASLRELDEWASRRFNTPQYQRSQRVRIFFIDGAFEADLDLLRLFEQYFLSHLLSLPRTLIVIMGRGRGYRWRDGRLRQKDRTHELAPFGIPEMQEQIHRMHLNGSLATPLDVIKRYGGGVPLTTSVLARFGVSIESINELIDLLLGERYRSLRTYFETLAPLDGFVEEEIEHLLLDTVRESGRERWRLAREIRQKLVDSQLVMWDQDSGLWRMDEALRFPLERWVHEAGITQWERIHRKMHSYYQKWAKEAEEYRLYFEERARYHLDQLNQGDQ